MCGCGSVWTVDCGEQEIVIMSLIMNQATGEKLHFNQLSWVFVAMKQVTLHSGHSIEFQNLSINGNMKYENFENSKEYMTFSSTHMTQVTTTEYHRPSILKSTYII